jgi:hypothetical protein
MKVIPRGRLYKKNSPELIRSKALDKTETILMGRKSEGPQDLAIIATGGLLATFDIEGKGDCMIENMQHIMTTNKWKQ